jgi:protein required for attachment to host cells
VANEFERLALVASPGFLGRVREHLGAPLQSRLAFTLDKDHVTQTAEEIRARLPERL